MANLQASPLSLTGSNSNLSVKSHNDSNRCCEKIIETVWSIFKTTLAIGTGMFFYVINPTFCLSSFVFGILFSEQVNSAIKKINLVWQSQKMIGSLAIFVASYLVLPATIAAGAILYSAYWGSQAYLSAQQPID